MFNSPSISTLTSVYRKAKVVHKVVSINWACVSFLRGFSIVLIEHKGKRRMDCAQAMASGVATAYAYTELSPCSGNRVVPLETQMLFLYRPLRLCRMLLVP